MTYVDLSDALAEIKAQIKAELLAELRGSPEAEPWPEWLSIETASRYLDVPVGRLRKLVARNQIPFHQEAKGCRVTFRKRDIDAWLDGFRIPPKDERNAT